MRAFGSASRGCTCHWIQNWMRVHFLDHLEEGISSRSWILVSCRMLAKLSRWPKSLWRTLKNGFQRLFKRTSQSYLLRVVVEEPDLLDPHCIYAVGKNGHLWHLTFVCPCGCKEVISLSSLPGDSPRWSLTQGEDGPTIHPSVWRKRGCRSHFFVRDGKVAWCNEGLL